MERFWYHDAAARHGVIPTGATGHDLMFLSAVAPVDLTSGRIIRSTSDLGESDREKVLSPHEFENGRLGPARAQTWAIYQNLAKVLESLGSSFGDVVRQRVFIRNLDDAIAVEDVLLKFFDEGLPATTFHGYSGKTGVDWPRVVVEFTALNPKSDARLERIVVPELEYMTTPFPAAVRVGSFVFTSGVTPHQPGSKRAISRLVEVGKDEPPVATGRAFSDATGEATKAQFWNMFTIFDRILQSQGSSIENLLRSNFYLRRSWHDNGYTYPFRSNIWGGDQNAPALTGFHVRNLHPDPDVLVLGDAVGLVPTTFQKSVGGHLDRLVGPVSMTTYAGPYWFVSGELAVDVTTHSYVDELEELDAGTWLAQSPFPASRGVMAQAWYIYHSLAQMMQADGTGLDRVLQQSIYLKDSRDYDAVAWIASVVFDGKMPPTTVVPVDDIGPYPELRLEIEAIALRDENL